MKRTVGNVEPVAAASAEDRRSRVNWEALEEFVQSHRARVRQWRVRASDEATEIASPTASPAPEGGI